MSLPHGWAVAKIEDLIAVDGKFSDGDWIESKDQDPNGTIRLLQLADIGDGSFLDKSNRFINEDVFETLKCTEVFEGDVLIARMPEPLGRACIAPKLDQRCITVVDVAILRPGSASVNSAWLMYFLNSSSIRKNMELQSSGTTRRRISRSKLSKLELPVPPLSEQVRIVAKLELILKRVDDCRVRLAGVRDLIARFRSCVLEAATRGTLTQDWRGSLDGSDIVKSFDGDDAISFGDYKFPLSWSTKKLAEIASIMGGVTKDSKKQDLEFVELPYLRVANVQRGYLDLSLVKSIRVPPNKVKEFLLAPGDVLFNEGGDIDKLGRGWIWEGQLPECTFQNHVFRARLINSDYEPRYFSWYGNSRGYNYFLRQGKQTTNLASINKTVLSALPVAVPPPDEQAEIVRRVEQLLSFAERVEVSCNSAFCRVEAMKSAVINKAFRGELVSQSEADAPASYFLDALSNAKLNRVSLDEKKSTKAAAKRATMKKTDTEAVKDAILKFGVTGFSFEELKDNVPTDYESLKSAIFELLADTTPLIAQVFDQDSKEMRFLRVQS